MTSIAPFPAESARPNPQAAEALTSVTDYPLYVIAAAAGDERSGCLAGFVTQCSIVPARFIVCISKVNHTFEVAERATSLSLHLLGERQQDLASLFGERTDDTFDKFEHCAWHEGVTGAPVLDECAAWVEGRVVTMTGVGDHEAFVISVVEGGSGTHRGHLMYSQAKGLQAAHPAA